MRNEVLNILRQTYTEQGRDLFADNYRLISYINDLLVDYPQERKQLCLAVRENIVKKILDEVSADDLSRCSTIVGFLVDVYSMSDEMATDIVNAICYAVFEKNYLTEKNTVVSNTVECNAGNEFVLDTRLTRYAGQDVDELTVPYGITVIGRKAFWGIKNVKKINLPETVKEIEATAFSCLESLKEINLPDSIESIGENAFSSCESLKELVLPEKLVTIEQSTFAFSGIERIKLPKSLKIIRSAAFQTCENLKELDIPESIKWIEKEAFMFSGIEKMRFSPNNSKYEFWEGEGILVENLGEKETMTYGANGRLLKGKTVERKLHWYKKGFEASVIIPHGISVIGKGAFPSSAKERRITVPSSVTKIEDGALPYNCTVVCAQGSAAEQYAKKCREIKIQINNSL